MQCTAEHVTADFHRILYGKCKFIDTSVTLNAYHTWGYLSLEDCSTVPVLMHLIRSQVQGGSRLGRGGG